MIGARHNVIKSVQDVLLHDGSMLLAQLRLVLLQERLPLNLADDVDDFLLEPFAVVLRKGIHTVIARGQGAWHSEEREEDGRSGVGSHC